MRAQLTASRISPIERLDGSRVTDTARKTRLLPALLAVAMTLAGVLAATVAFAQTRWVVVNGQRMSDQQISQLEYFHCAQIPNGWYWVNLANGAWGYVGNWQIQGYFGDQCNMSGNHQARQRRQSLSERGLLYSPNEILSGSR